MAFHYSSLISSLLSSSFFFSLRCLKSSFSLLMRSMMINDFECFERMCESPRDRKREYFFLLIRGLDIFRMKILVSVCRMLQDAVISHICTSLSRTLVSLKGNEMKKLLLRILMKCALCGTKDK